MLCQTMLAALLVCSTLFTSCTALGALEETQLSSGINTSSCELTGLQEPNDILCDMKSKAVIRCWVERARRNNITDWVNVCVFHIPPQIRNFASYRCEVLDDFGPVKCNDEQGANSFTSTCLFTTYQCTVDCVNKGLALYAEGGYCAATDRWCPKNDVYLFYAPLLSDAAPNGRNSFSNFQKLNAQAPSYCAEWPTWKVAVVVSCGFVILLVFVSWALIKLRRCRKLDKKALANTKNLEDLLMCVPSNKEYLQKEMPESFTGITEYMNRPAQPKTDVPMSNQENDIRTCCEDSVDMSTDNASIQLQTSGGSREYDSGSTPVSLLRHTSTTRENVYVDPHNTMIKITALNDSDAHSTDFNGNSNCQQICKVTESNHVSRDGPIALAFVKTDQQNENLLNKLNYLPKSTYT